MHLNKEHKRQICHLLITQRFKEEWEALEADAGRLAEDVYRDVLGKEYDDIQAAPDNWFPVDDSISVHIGGNVHYLYFAPNMRGRYNCSVSEPEKNIHHRMPRYANQRCAKKYSPGSKLSRRFEALQRRHEKLEEQKQKLRNEINATLADCRTVKKLVDTWPAIKEFVEKVVRVPVTPNLPAVPIADLNKKLGLTKKK